MKKTQKSMICTLVVSSFVMFSLASRAAEMSMPATAAKPEHGTHAAETSQAKGVGIVKKIDPQLARLTLAHEAIPSLNWPPMTMPFTLKDNTLLTGLKVGDKVEFTLQNETLITQLKKQ